MGWDGTLLCELANHVAAKYIVLSTMLRQCGAARVGPVWEVLLSAGRSSGEDAAKSHSWSKTVPKKKKLFQCQMPVWNLLCQQHSPAAYGSRFTITEYILLLVE